MDEMEEKLGNILNNPKMMQQIMSMAQSMGAQDGSRNEPAGQAENTGGGESLFPEIDVQTLQKISGFAQKSNIDKREQALLRALSAYLSKERIGKLEKAMRAAKIAKFASSSLNLKRSPFPTGR